MFIDSEKANVEISTPTDIVMGADEFNLTSTGLSIEHGIYMNSPAGDISYQAKEDVELQGNFDFWGHRDVAIVADNVSSCLFWFVLLCDDVDDYFRIYL